MSLMPLTPVRLVPDLLRARGLKVSVDRIRDALQSGAVPGRRDGRRRQHWVLTPEDVDAVERYFRELATPGAQKGGAAGLEQAKERSQQKACGLSSAGHGGGGGSPARLWPARYFFLPRQGEGGLKKQHLWCLGLCPGILHHERE
jgi:hypothetical protein